MNPKGIKDERSIERKEIEKFTEFGHDGLNVIFGENDETVFSFKDPDSIDDRKNRTFLSMFNKIFDVPASIVNWDDESNL
jgi:hypothetical protein